VGSDALVAADMRHEWGLGDPRRRLCKRGRDEKNTERLCWANEEVLLMKVSKVIP
jgi:hypothetical protein